ncbi:hypothetical protein SELMODRAFT_109240 [Selaginella moellendorffii]|uniref:Ubiquitin-like domain-containing protein n=1 Tax=Selaginella moellendorffii TaxID=88036 RepID=D8S5S1_SELML|nr:hypothetical protein SELMODRAFT_109240 [Selaginella moellendorffii]
MVLLHFKQGDDRQFLFEAPGAECVDAIVRDVVAVNNLQLRILHLVQECGQLLEYGPIKSKEEQEQDEEEEDEGNSTGASSSSSRKERGPFYKKDPSGRRTGEACDPNVGETLKRTLSDAETSVSKDQVLYKVPLSSFFLKEMIQNIKGAVMICYPQGLPRHDPVQQQLTGTFEGMETLNPATAQLWWAGKELMRDKRLADYVGKNDKTKIIAKLQERGRGAPMREPPVDAETQKAMMSWYYKRQQEEKTLKENTDDSYTNSEWANPQALKAHFHGTSNIRFR